jgi:hypothetical protein
MAAVDKNHPQTTKKPEFIINRTECISAHDLVKVSEIQVRRIQT